MTQTVPLQVKEALKDLFGSIPGVHGSYLNRAQPVGENETERGAVIILREEVTQSGTDNQWSLALILPLRVSVYVDIQVLGPSVDELVDPYWQAINTIFHGPARSLPGVQGVKLIQAQHNAEGEAGRSDFIYNVTIRVNQLDLSQPSP